MVQQLPLTYRARGRDRLRLALGEGSQDSEDKMMKAFRSSNVRLALGTMLVVLFFLTLVPYPQEAGRESAGVLTDGAYSLSGQVATIKRNIETDVELTVRVAVPSDSTAGNRTIKLTGNRVELAVNPRKCKNPGIWVRLVGDALVAVELVEDSSKRIWSGSFDLPAAGSYALEARWYGCGDAHTHYTVLEPIDFLAVGSPTQSSTEEDSLFADSSWIHSGGETLNGRHLPRYMWKHHGAGHRSSPDDLVSVHDTFVSQNGTVKPDEGFYEFSELSNYELVCFWGSQTMSDIRDSFLEVKGVLFPHQRPFKFHYYNISTFERPDRDWEDDPKTRSRKCKHILVSLDEDAEPGSQAEYEEKVTTFIGHLLKFMDDDTFPIWFFTVNEPPMHATNCHSPYLPRSSGHPCNDVLRELFSANTFPERVRLLDNTRVSLPQFDENKEDVLANIAMRILVLVGWKVSDWRSKGQIGAGDGLHRNDTVIPNFELTPYPWP